ncbi:ISAs1 family transposase [Treponema sp. OMZ 857]|uniref:ISAs1 family transposase n=1 Tax=Treponema sp. OMZ 857 TaxID=1643513 RepID=UPI0020A306D2|nr:ISAs1 family transposase [Treponema sp. OMZ 857]
MTLQEAFENIKDERIDRCKKHNLVDILMLVFMGVLCGYKSIEQIQFYATLSEQTLKKYLKLENGIPSSDTILRVLARIDAKQLEKVFIEYARETFGKHIAENEVVAIDGKLSGALNMYRQAKIKPHKAAHVVSAWAHSLGVCFGQVKTEEKSNEITAIPELLDLLDLKGMIITIDAMGCQKKNR